MTKQKLIPSLLLALLLSGCSMIPAYERPVTQTPALWSAENMGAETTIARDWWKNFNSAELNALMDEALLQNNDLAAASARVAQSRGLLRAAGASKLPSVSANGSGGYEYTNPDEGSTESDPVGSAGLSIAYELDLFGANAADIAAKSADVDSAKFTRDALALMMMGEVAKGYFNTINLQERLAVADKNVESANELLRIVQARFDAGDTTMLDVAQQKTEKSNTLATRADIEQRLALSKNALAVLVGKPPQSLTLTATNLTDLTIPQIGAGQPSMLLERRPDIRASEENLKSANADIGAARAAFYPNVTLGLDWSVAAAPLGDPATTALALASSIAAPIFSGGLLEGNLAFSKAKKEEMLSAYRGTVLESFRDVEDALATVRSAQLRETALETALNESRNAYDLSQKQYDVGVIDFQTLLINRRTMLTAEDNYIQTKNDRLAASVDLYKSLGGGWQK